jgi:hypothetical protein
MATILRILILDRFGNFLVEARAFNGEDTGYELLLRRLIG